MSCYEVMFIFSLIYSSFVNRPIRYNTKHKMPQLKYMRDKDRSEPSTWLPKGEDLRENSITHVY